MATNQSMLAANKTCKHQKVSSSEDIGGGKIFGIQTLDLGLQQRHLGCCKLPSLCLSVTECHNTYPP